MEVQRPNVQSICEEEIIKVFELTKKLVPETDNCVYMGGEFFFKLCSNSIIRDHYPNLWILPNPGDAGSSLGSAIFVWRTYKLTSPFTGYDIKGKYPTTKVLNELLKGNIVGIGGKRRV